VEAQNVSQNPVNIGEKRCTLCAFTPDSSNNNVENDVRPSVVGRKRWLFIGHPDAGWRSAVIYTIIQSCRRRGINPQEYLTDVLGRLPSMKNHEVKDVLPSRWKPSPARPA
jgi:hypothetical protein